MRKLAIFLSLFTCGVTFGQQLSQQSQYMINPYLLNPAAAGDEDFAEFFVGIRSQFMGFDGAPRSNFFSVQTPLEKHHGRAVSNKKMSQNHHGVGLIVANDNVGHFKNVFAVGSYAYNMGLSDDFRIAFGASLGFKRTKFEGADASTQIFDPAVAESSLSRSGMRLDLGTWLHGKNYFLGVSVLQLFGGKVSFDEIQTEEALGNKLVNHYHFMGGYRFEIPDQITIIPSFKVSMVNTLPLWIDINTKVRVKDMFWAGVSYRVDNAVSILAGLALKHHLDLGLAYDIPVNGLNGYESIEVMLGYRIDFTKKVRNPNHYW